MWFPAKATVEWGEALSHLSKDRVMRGVIGRVGPCTLAPRRDYFVALCQAIFTQQVSTVVATVLFARFKLLFPRLRPTPEGVLALSDEQLATAGLSRQKKVYLRDLAAKFAEGAVPTRRFGKMSDEEIIESLLPIKGIGRWTAEMFLIFVMNRPDVLPVDDLGVKKGFERFYGLRGMPTAAEMERIAEPWRPWRTVGTWYLWKGQID
jgi:DNA-3-methyladenine glycosylase II